MNDGENGGTGGSPGGENGGTGGLASVASGSGGGESTPTGIFQDFMLADGRFTDGHADKLTGDLEPYRTTLAEYQTFPDVVKALHTLKQSSDGGVKIPGEGSTEAEVAAFRKAIGVPETAAGYNLPTEKAEIAKFAHENNLTKAQAEKILEREQVAAQAQKAAAEKAEQDIIAGELKKLTDKWGNETGARAQKAVETAELFGLDLDHYQSAELLFVFEQLHGAFAQSEALKSQFGAPGLVRESTNPRSIVEAVYNKTHPRAEAFWNGDPDTLAWMSQMEELASKGR